MLVFEHLRDAHVRFIAFLGISGALMRHEEHLVSAHRRICRYRPANGQPLGDAVVEVVTTTGLFGGDNNPFVSLPELFHHRRFTMN